MNPNSLKPGIKIGEKLFGRWSSRIGLSMFLNAILTSCGVSTAYAPGVGLAETPASLNDPIAEQLKAGILLKWHDTTNEQKDKTAIQEYSKQFGPFSLSKAAVGFDPNDPDHKPIISEVLVFEKGAYTVFYDQEKKSASGLYPTTIQYGKDTKTGNLVMSFAIMTKDQEGKNVETPYLSYISNTAYNDAVRELIRKAVEGASEEERQAAKKQLDSYLFDNPTEQIEEVIYNNLSTKKGIDLVKKDNPSWLQQIGEFLSNSGVISAKARGLSPAEQTAQAPTSTPISPDTPLPPAVTMAELGITDPNSDLAKAFKGIEKYAQKESDGVYFVNINGEKYILQGGWNLHADLNNAYAPATVNAVDSQGNQVMLIWNKEGLAVNSPLSADIENPTDFDDTNKLTTLQRYLLQNPDLFSQRSRGFPFQFEKTENGNVVYLRTDYFGNQSKPSNVWLRYRASNGNIYYINPTDLNDVNGRKVIMCAYSGNVTNDAEKRKFLSKSALNKEVVVWPILKATLSFFENLKFANVPGASDFSDLYDLLESQRESIDNLKWEGFDNYPISESIANGEAQLPPYEMYPIFYDKDWPFPDGIQEMIIPCDLR